MVTGEHIGPRSVARPKDIGFGYPVGPNSVGSCFILYEVSELQCCEGFHLCVKGQFLL